MQAAMDGKVPDEISEPHDNLRKDQGQFLSIWDDLVAERDAIIAERDATIESVMSIESYRTRLRKQRQISI